MTGINLVCIIEDDQLSVFGIKKLMELTSFAKNSLFYANGEQALEGLNNILQKGEDFPDLILMDINMPVMDGWEFLEKYGELGIKDGTKVYVVSSSIDPEEIERVKENPLVQGYLKKPLTLKKVKDLKVEICGNQEGQ